MKLVDSSGWLEHLTDGPLADVYAGHQDPLSDVLTPTVVLYEMHKVTKRERSRGRRPRRRRHEGSQVVGLTASIALRRMPASSTASRWRTQSSTPRRGTHDAGLITSDADFDGLPGVTYVDKSTKRR